MKSKSLLAFLLTFSLASVIVYLISRDETVFVAPHVEPYVFKTFQPFDFEDPERKKFDENVTQFISARNFRALEDLASTVSGEKSRFRGGAWRIWQFDTIISRPTAERVNEAAWDAHISFLHGWIKASPHSIYARTALANAEVGYGHYFRGDGYAQNVPQGGWERYLEHLDKARSALDEARQMPAKYVGFHGAELNLAMLSGPDRKTFEKRYAEAIAFEPTCEPFYKQKAIYLLPQWSGSFGEAESYAERVKMDLGGDEGIKMYSVIIGEMGRVGDANYVNQHRIMWDDVVKGFELREAEFGPSTFQLNELARLSFYKNDHATTCEAFRRIDSPAAYERDVWRSVGHFNAVRAIAINDICEGLKSPVFDRFPKSRQPQN